MVGPPSRGGGGEKSFQLPPLLIFLHSAIIGCAKVSGARSRLANKILPPSKLLSFKFAAHFFVGGRGSEEKFM